MDDNTRLSFNSFSSEVNMSAVNWSPSGPGRIQSKWNGRIDIGVFFVLGGTFKRNALSGTDKEAGKTLCRVPEVGSAENIVPRFKLIKKTQQKDHAADCCLIQDSRLMNFPRFR